MRYHDAAGRPRPLEVEQVARWIFEAGRRLGAPQPFLARELAEGAAHFLDADPDEVIPEDELHDRIETTIRELGHPALACAYREQLAAPRREPAAKPQPDCGRSFDAYRANRVRDAVALEDVYPADLISAHEEGWLVLDRPAAPLELFAAAVPAGTKMLESIRAARNYAGGRLAIDGADIALARESGEPNEVAERFARETDFALTAYGLTATVHLNQAEPPPWDAPLAGGDLFADADAPPNPERLHRIRSAVLAALRRTSNVRAVLHWRDAFPERGTILSHDEPGRTIDLGFGLTRDHPFCLGRAGVDLHKFLERIGPDAADAEGLKKKWMSLARLARAAGYARREFLRQHGRPACRDQFRLDRAAWIVVPKNLGAAAEMLAGDEVSSPGAVFRHARNIISAFAEALQRDGERGLACSLEWAEFPANDPCFVGQAPAQLIRRMRQLHKDGLASPCPVSSPDAERCRGLTRAEVRP